MARILVLDPTAPPPEPAVTPVPEVRSLAAKTVGIRLDRVWRSFEWIVSEWEPGLRQAGAAVRRWVAGNRVGDEGERTRLELEEFVGGVDLAVVGLGN